MEEPENTEATPNQVEQDSASTYNDVFDSALGKIDIAELKFFLEKLDGLDGFDDELLNHDDPQTYQQLQQSPDPCISVTTSVHEISSTNYNDTQAYKNLQQSTQFSVSASTSEQQFSNSVTINYNNPEESLQAPLPALISEQKLSSAGPTTSYDYSQAYESPEQPSQFFVSASASEQQVSNFVSSECVVDTQNISSAVPSFETQDQIPENSLTSETQFIRPEYQTSSVAVQNTNPVVSESTSKLQSSTSDFLMLNPQNQLTSTILPTNNQGSNVFVSKKDIQPTTNSDFHPNMSSSKSPLLRTESDVSSLPMQNLNSQLFSNSPSFDPNLNNFSSKSVYSDPVPELSNLDAQPGHRSSTSMLYSNTQLITSPAFDTDLNCSNPDSPFSDRVFISPESGLEHNRRLSASSSTSTQYSNTQLIIESPPYDTNFHTYNPNSPFSDCVILSPKSEVEHNRRLSASSSTSTQYSNTQLIVDSPPVDTNFHYSNPNLPFSDRVFISPKSEVECNRRLSAESLTLTQHSNSELEQQFYDPNMTHRPKRVQISKNVSEFGWERPQSTLNSRSSNYRLRNYQQTVNLRNPNFIPKSQSLQSIPSHFTSLQQPLASDYSSVEYLYFDSNLTSADRRIANLRSPSVPQYKKYSNISSERQPTKCVLTSQDYQTKVAPTQTSKPKRSTTRPKKQCLNPNCTDPKCRALSTAQIFEQEISLNYLGLQCSKSKDEGCNASFSAQVNSYDSKSKQVEYVNQRQQRYSQPSTSHYTVKNQKTFASPPNENHHENHSLSYEKYVNQIQHQAFDDVQIIHPVHSQKFIKPRSSSQSQQTYQQQQYNYRHQQQEQLFLNQYDQEQEQQCLQRYQLQQQHRQHLQQQQHATPHSNFVDNQRCSQNIVAPSLNEQNQNAFMQHQKANQDRHPCYDNVKTNDSSNNPLPYFSGHHTMSYEKNIKFPNCRDPETPCSPEEERLLNLETPKNWCSVTYYEFSEQVGDAFTVERSYPELTIDGYTDPSRGPRFCLGALTKVNRNPKCDKVRSHIGKGVILEHHSGGDVWLRCVSDHCVYVQSYFLDRLARRKLYDTVHKIFPSAYVQVFDLQDCCRLMKSRLVEMQKVSRAKAATLVEQPPSGLDELEALDVDEEIHVNELKKQCSIRLSFVKGWGPDYQKLQIRETPCWINIQLQRPLRLLDEILLSVKRTKK